MHVCVCVCVGACVRVRTYMCLCMHACMHVCKHIHATLCKLLLFMHMHLSSSSKKPKSITCAQHATTRSARPDYLPLWGSLGGTLLQTPILRLVSISIGHNLHMCVHVSTNIDGQHPRCTCTMEESMHHDVDKYSVKQDTMLKT